MPERRHLATAPIDILVLDRQRTFADAIAVYMLSLYLDVDYQDLRERDYPLLAPEALAERLRKINELFPVNSGYEFAIYHRRRPQ